MVGETREKLADVMVSVLVVVLTGLIVWSFAGLLVMGLSRL